VIIYLKSFDKFQRIESETRASSTYGTLRKGNIRLKYLYNEKIDRFIKAVVFGWSLHQQAWNSMVSKVLILILSWGLNCEVEEYNKKEISDIIEK